MSDPMQNPPAPLANQTTREAIIKTWAVLDVNTNPASRSSDSSNCYVLPQEMIGAADEAASLSRDDVYFNTASGFGITLAQALHGQHDELLGRDVPAFSKEANVSQKIAVKIQFQEYKLYQRQVTALRSTVDAEAVSLGKLAEKIAQETKKCLNGQETLEIGGCRLSFEEIVLWKLRRATKGSWQPEFYVRCLGQA